MTYEVTIEEPNGALIFQGSHATWDDAVEHTRELADAFARKTATLPLCQKNRVIYIGGGGDYAIEHGATHDAPATPRSYIMIDTLYD